MFGSMVVFELQCVGFIELHCIGFEVLKSGHLDFSSSDW